MLQPALLPLRHKQEKQCLIHSVALISMDQGSTAPQRYRLPIAVSFELRLTKFGKYTIFQLSSSPNLTFS